MRRMIRTNRCPLVIVDLTHSEPFGHWASLDDQRPQRKPGLQT